MRMLITLLLSVLILVSTIPRASADYLVNSYFDGSKTCDGFTVIKPTRKLNACEKVCYAPVPSPSCDKLVKVSRHSDVITEEEYPANSNCTGQPTSSRNLSTACHRTEHDLQPTQKSIISDDEYYGLQNKSGTGYKLLYYRSDCVGEPTTTTSAIYAATYFDKCVNVNLTQYRSYKVDVKKATRTKYSGLNCKGTETETTNIFECKNEGTISSKLVYISKSSSQTSAAGFPAITASAALMTVLFSIFLA